MQTKSENQTLVGALPDKDGIEMLLEASAQWKKRDPSPGDEEECVENIFSALCSCMSIPANQTLFRHAEGFELMLRMMKEQKYTRHCAIKTVDFALSKSVSNCNKFIEIGGLKTFFPAFMGKKLLVKAAKNQVSASEIEEHVVAILESLISCLDPER